MIFCELIITMANICLLISNVTTHTISLLKIQAKNHNTNQEDVMNKCYIILVKECHGMKHMHCKVCRGDDNIHISVVLVLFKRL